MVYDSVTWTGFQARPLDPAREDLRLAGLLTATDRWIAENNGRLRYAVAMSQILIGTAVLSATATFVGIGAFNKQAVFGDLDNTWEWVAATVLQAGFVLALPLVGVFALLAAGAIFLNGSHAGAQIQCRLLLWWRPHYRWPRAYRAIWAATYAAKLVFATAWALGWTAVFVAIGVLTTSIIG